VCPSAYLPARSLSRTAQVDPAVVDKLGMWAFSSRDIVCSLHDAENRTVNVTTAQVSFDKSKHIQVFACNMTDAIWADVLRGKYPTASLHNRRFGDSTGPMSICMHGRQAHWATAFLDAYEAGESLPSPTALPLGELVSQHAAQAPYKLAICVSPLTGVHRHYGNFWADDLAFESLWQWIEYYRMVGVEHFFIYDAGPFYEAARTGDWSASAPLRMMHSYIARGIVTIIPWVSWQEQGWGHYRNFQEGAINHCGLMFGASAVWLGSFDVDEW
jgi:hypothetical protein